MSLSSDLVSQFVKVATNNTKAKSETTVYGTTVEYNGKKYVRLDGSELLTPVETTVATKPDERVTVMIKDHTATVTGNLSSPSARAGDVDNLASQISEFEIVLAYKIQTDELAAINATIDNLKATIAKFENMEAVSADIETLRAKYASLEHVTAEDVKALNAEIENLQVKFGEFTNISAEDMKVINGYIQNLSSYNANFTYVSAEVLSAVNAKIKNLDTEYANIDFANIGEAAIKKIFSDYGLIKDLIVGDGTITGELVGVTIKGDLIEGNTIKADKLVVKGSDGLYYKLNFESGNFKDAEEVPDEGIHGSVIIAESITADRIAVTDLVAFGATIGGFKIGDHSLYSGVKSSVDNNTRGVYLDDNGQVAFGDTNSFIKYYKDADGVYRIAISADSILFGSNKQNINTIPEDVAAAKKAADNAQKAADDADTKVQQAVKDLETAKQNLTNVTNRVDATEEDIAAAQQAVDEAQTAVIQAQTDADNAKTLADNAQKAADEAQTTADETAVRVSTSESRIQQLADSIAMLVTGSDGSSMMTQTADGWTFNMSNIIDKLDAAVKDVGSLSGNVDDLNSSVDTLTKTVGDVGKLTNYIRFKLDGDQPCIELGESDSAFKLLITNTAIKFMEGSSTPAHINDQALNIGKAVIEEELQIGGYTWVKRSNGHTSLTWKGVDS